MTYKSTNEYSQKQYTAEFDTDSITGMVFNNGKEQDPDATYVAGAAGYYYDAATNTVKTWGTSEETTAAPDGTTAAPEETTVAGDKYTFYYLPSADQEAAGSTYKRA